jgi:hypothetical protein
LIESSGLVTSASSLSLQIELALNWGTFYAGLICKMESLSGWMCLYLHWHTVWLLLAQEHVHS